MMSSYQRYTAEINEIYVEISHTWPRPSTAWTLASTGCAAHSTTW